MLKEIEEAVRFYIKQGIVTRKDVRSLDVRTIARRFEDEFKKLGYTEVMLAEIALSGYRDYSGVLYNSNEYTYNEVKDYMIKNVLSET
ncbi:MULTISPECIES: hypothetical protein [Clostridium]|uniref:Uncharacterized protein n=1 Tax=Clostridium frigoriphilum TaxID=443253 RepID=A0ABU7UUE2_9CLOT|nr:hypothetical protein [Clostridium sp. DSM 17811]MBU3101707.1 hypothetical protein [Clostridium sp. DSM 17811]